MEDIKEVPAFKPKPKHVEFDTREEEKIRHDLAPKENSSQPASDVLEKDKP
jgi:hypothetical protein